LRWLAISGESRGGVWNLARNERVFNVRGFRGAYLETTGTTFADFNKFEQTDRGIAKMDTSKRSVEVTFKIGDMQATQYASVLVRHTHLGKDEWKQRNMVFEGLDPRSGESLWKRTYLKEAPQIVSRRNAAVLVFMWPANSDGAKEEIKSDTNLNRWSQAGAGSEDYFLEAVEARTGKTLAGLVVHSGKGSFRITEADAAGDWMAVADSSNRLLIYSLSSGQQTEKLFGRRPVISGASGLLAAQNERGQLTVYDLGALAKRDEYVLTSPIVFVEFAPDGKRLFVLTAKQSAYVLEMTDKAAAAKN